MKPFNIGIIGLGARGVVLLSSLIKIPELNVAAVCDNDPGRVERYRELCQNP